LLILISCDFVILYFALVNFNIITSFIIAYFNILRFCNSLFCSCKIQYNFQSIYDLRFIADIYDINI